MKYDCGFVKENNRFRYRTGGIIVYDNKMLFVKSNVGNYYYMVGGAVNMGEPSKSCIEREICEETGIQMCAERLAVVCENFFKGIGGNIDGFDCHTLEFYYYMKFNNGDLNLLRSTTDIGEELVWLPIEQIEQYEIKPTFIKERIHQIISENNIIHIVEERDR